MDSAVFFINISKHRSYTQDLSKIQCHESKEYGHVVSHKKRNLCAYCKKTVILSLNAGLNLKEMINPSQVSEPTKLLQRNQNKKVYLKSLNSLTIKSSTQTK